MYSYEMRVGYSRTDENRIMTMESIIDCFQDCSCFQGEKLGIGFSYLESNHLAWMINAWQIEVKKFPLFYDKIKVATFPYDFKGFFGYRNFLIEDEKGERIVSANSVWTLMDMKKKCPARLTDKMIQTYVKEERLPMESVSRKILLPSEEICHVEKMEEIAIKEYHIDSNNHVNNGQYVRMAYTYLPKDRKFGCMRVEYRKQAVLGDIILPFVYEKDGVYDIALCDEEKKPYAVIEVCQDNDHRKEQDVETR